MAADYTSSTQKHCWTERQETYQSSAKCSQDIQSLKERFPLPDQRHIFYYFQQQIGKLGRRLAIRQPVLATAMVFLHRFYSRVEIRQTNPFLVLATSFYLACKTEECPQHIRVVVAEAKTLWSDLIPSDIARLGECEFFLISELNAQLIIHHPYRHLHQYQSELSLMTDELAVAWSVVNDHYATGLPLRHSPNLIAGTAVILAVVIRPSHANVAGAHVSNSLNKVSASSLHGAIWQATQGKGQRLVKWLAQDATDLEAIVECTQEIISLYASLDRYSEKETKEALVRFIKAQEFEK